EDIPACIMVMDDFLLVGEGEYVEALESLLLTVWRLTNFCCPPEKRSTWGGGGPEDAIRWLGARWLWDGSTPTLSLLRPASDKSETGATGPRGVSKRSIFRQAGRFIAVSLGVGEALSRAHCDVARALVGTAPTWDSPLGEKEALEAKKHLVMAKLYWSECSTAEDTALALYSEVKTIRVECDAAGSGFGWVWKTPEGAILAAEGKVQSKSMCINAWHSNRRELHALAVALQRLDEALHCFPRLERIQLYTDNRVALRNVDRWNPPPCKSVERKAILRLRGIVCDCIHDFETRSPPIRVETAHIRGLDNRIADLLSRAPLLTKYTPYAPSVIPPNPKVSQVAVTVGCGAVDSQCWLFGSSAGCLALPSFRDWLLSRR
ncbi:hypothetical protein FOZ62_011170, partial [Perkinsus olseni]